MRDIANAAGLSTGAVMNYFPTRDAILQSLAEQGREHQDERFGAVAASEDPGAALSSALASLAGSDAWSETAAAELEVLVEGRTQVGVGAIVRDSTEQTLSRLSEVFRKAGQRPAQARRTARRFLGAYYGLTALSVLGVRLSKKEVEAWILDTLERNET